MRTTHFNGHLYRGCLPGGGVSAGCVCVSRGCVSSGCVYPGGVCLGVCSGRIHPLPIACWDTPPVNRQMPVKIESITLPHTSFAGSNKFGNHTITILRFCHDLVSILLLIIKQNDIDSRLRTMNLCHSKLKEGNKPVKNQCLT